MNNNDFKLNSIGTINWTKVKYSHTSTSTDKHWMQSACLITTDNSIVVFYHGNSNTLIEKISLNTYQVTSSSTSYNYNHANDATYNPNTQKIYLAPAYDQNSGHDRNLIYIINKDSFVKEGEIHIGNDTTKSVSGIAYDSVNNVYYVDCGGVAIKLDSSFNIISSFTVVGVDFSASTFQNYEFYDSKLFVLYNNKLLVFDDSGILIKNIALDATIETEGLVSIGDGNFLMGKIYDYYPGIFKSTIYQCNIFDVGLNNTLLTVPAKITTNHGANIQSNINYVTRRDHSVYCNICFTNITSVATSYDHYIGLLPAGFRPSTYKRLIGACSGSNFARFDIGTDGRILIYATSISSIQSSYWFHLDTSFLVD